MDRRAFGTLRLVPPVSGSSSHDAGLDDRPLGATPDPAGGFRFRVWAPRATRVEIEYASDSHRLLLERVHTSGYFEGRDPAASPGTRYWIQLDEHRWPDPASRSQPDGGLGPSALTDLAAAGRPSALASPVELARSAIYELHVGAFTQGGTFLDVVPHLEELADTGITAIELLPVVEDGGERGWGYGPIFQFAPRRAYGGPAGLLRLVDAAHRAGVAVLLDVVYNHWGPGSGFLEEFGPYFHPRATTPWGPTPNLIAAGSDEVRRYFFENGRMWIEEYGLDGFRLDAVHEIYDRAPHRFWAEFSDASEAAGVRVGRHPILIAESDLNDVQILRPTALGGWGLDGQWSDDFHHALHAALTGERMGYYADYGPLATLARAFERPFVFEGQFSRGKGRRHGASSAGTAPGHFVVFDQNHDQVGNRGDGARLTTLLSPAQARAALALTLLSPYVPMLFMGEEYGETRPFYFFGDPPAAARERLAQGRIRDLRENGFETPPPDPSEVTTLEASRLDWARADSEEGRSRRRFVRALLKARGSRPGWSGPGATETRFSEIDRWLAVCRSWAGGAMLLLANLGERAVQLPPLPWSGPWHPILASHGPVSESEPWGSGPSKPGPSIPDRSVVCAERPAPTIGPRF